MEKFYLEAKIEIQEETKELKKAVAAAIDLPQLADKQPDLLYFTAVFVSAGTNLNNAHFAPSELIKAEDTIVSKALDVEHKEEDIIGHLYDRAFVDSKGESLDLEELASKEAASLDSEYGNGNIHVIIAGVMYKNRFPALAQEIFEGDWKVSMECYYDDYDVKVGDTIMTRREAEVMGLANEDSIFGKTAKILKKGKEVAKGKIERVLRNIVFSGCGIVKNPANPDSVIIETANEKNGIQDSKEIIILEYDKLEEKTNNIKQIENNNKLTSDKDEENNSVITDPSEDKEPNTNEETDVGEEANIQYDDTTGVCVSYKRRVYAGEPQGPDTEIIHENWCMLYDSTCTSYSRDTTDPKCLRVQAHKAAKDYAKKLLKERNESGKIAKLTKKLVEVLEKTKKLD